MLTGALLIAENLSLVVDDSGFISFFDKSTSQSSSDILQKYLGVPVEDIPIGSFLLPPFVDTHLHAPQFLYQGVGLHLPLMQWLQEYAYKAETRLDSDPELAGRVYERLADRLIEQGTGAVLLFGTINVRTNLILARSMQSKGIRALVGKLSMDMSSDPEYVEASAEAALKALDTFVEECHHITNGLPSHLRFVEPVVTPRFIPTCSDALLFGLSNASRRHDLRVQSHLAESLDEVEWVKQQRGKDDMTVFEETGLLAPRTIHAHCTFLSEASLSHLVKTQTSVAHCPLSNAYFSAEPFKLKEALRQGVKVGLGSDIAGGYSLDIMNAMRSAVMVSKMREGSRVLFLQATPDGDARVDIDWKTSLYLATRGGAVALDLPQGCGVFEVGAPFDAQQIALFDPTTYKGVGALDNFEENNPESISINIEVLEKWWCLGDHRNRTGLWIQGLKRL